MVKKVKLFAILFLFGCASAPEEPIGKYHSANSINDLFAIEQGMPMREVKQQEFFFKKCEMESRRPDFGKSEFSCTAGPE
jgi:hypothetical protein